MLVAILIVAGVLASMPLTAIFWTAVSHIRFHTYHRAHGITYEPLGVSGWAAFYGRTVVSVLLLYWWSVRALLSDGLRRPTGKTTGCPVLCVHGFHLNGPCMWGVRRTLERSGRPTRAVFLGVPYRSAGAYARRLTGVMSALLAETQAKELDIVAHSMGGIIVRHVLAQQPELAGRVRRVVTLGSPHYGTGLLRWIRFGPVYRMMGRGVPYLRELPSFAASAPHVIATTVASTHDLVVYPLETAHLESARHVTLERAGHLGLLTRPSALDQIVGLLGDG